MVVLSPSASSRAPTSNVSSRPKPFSSESTGSSSVVGHSTHLPLPRANFPLLHSLLDSDEYRQTLERHPELAPSPAPRRPNHHAAAKKPPKAPSSLFSGPSTVLRKSTTSTVESDLRKVDRSTRSTSKANRVNSRSTTNAGPFLVSDLLPTGRLFDVSPVPKHRVPSAQDVKQSPEPWTNFVELPPRRPPLPPVDPRQVASGGVEAGNGASVEVAHTPTREPRDNSAALPPSLGTSRSLPDLVHPETVRAHRPRDTSYPVHPSAQARHSMTSLRRPSLESTKSSSFGHALSSLKRMLTRRDSRRSRLLSKSSTSFSESDFAGSTTRRTRSRSSSGFSVFVDAGEPLVTSPTSATANPALEESISLSASTTEPATNKQLQPSNSPRREALLSSSEAPTRLRLQARAPAGFGDMPSYLESRSQLLKLLAEGPGGDVVRASPVLQETIKRHRESKPVTNRKGFLGWPSPRRSSQSTRPIEGEDGSTSRRTTLRRKKSVVSTVTLDGRRSGRRRPAADSVESLQDYELVDQDGPDRPTTAYSSYGERWEDGRQRRRSGDLDFEDEAIWRKWRGWIRERRYRMRQD